jgi:ketosteroid isomerase-like protein
MSEANKATLLRANEAIARLDFDGFLAHCTEDTTWTFVGEQTLKGKAAVRQWMQKTYHVPPSVSVKQLIAEADRLVAVGEITVMPPGGDGKPQGYCDVWNFRDGKLNELQAFVVNLS